jgi:predicted DNA-binding transcriptional regulator AlpA
MDGIQDRIVRKSEVLKRVGLSANALNEAIQRGAFPPPLKLTEKRSIGWRCSDIDSWIQNLQPVGTNGAGNECTSNGAAHGPSANSQLAGE